MAGFKCPECPFRARYDNNPKSILGRLWKFHTRFCPGWKGYLKSIPEEERAELKRKYS